jgi:type III secretory pathway component EscR
MTTLNPFWLILLTALLALIPVMIGLVTSYVKVSVVLGMLRSGLGAQQVPGNLVVMAVSLAITFYVMSPVVLETAELAEQINFSIVLKNPSIESLEKLAPLFEPWREFMRKHAGQRELKALGEMRVSALADLPGLKGGNPPAVVQAPSNAVSKNLQEDPPLRVLLIAFVLTELKEAFAMGFVLILPFLVIDLIVANLLAGLGMFMVSPLLISLPLKLILFVVSDGWVLLTRGLINSYGA